MTGGELAQAYAPELQLVGVAAAAPTTDLVANLAGGGDPSVRAFIAAFATYSWSRHFNAPLSTIGKPATRQLIARLAQNCVLLDRSPALRTMLGVSVLRRQLKHVDLGRLQPWATIAQRNSAGRLPPGAPVFLAQNPNDAIVAPAVTQRFAKTLCAQGASVRYQVLAGAGHQTSGADSTQAALGWIAARFAGQPAPSDCARL